MKKQRERGERSEAVMRDWGGAVLSVLLYTKKKKKKTEKYG